MRHQTDDGSTALRRYTRVELARFDGSEPGRPVLIAYDGKVYDVTASFMWMGGRHFWKRAGHDLTGEMEESPHDRSMLERAVLVGVLVDD